MPEPPATLAMQLPMSVADLDLGWMSAALRSRYPDITVEGMQVREVQLSTATRVFIEMDYGNRTAELPGRLCIKGGFDCVGYEKKSIVFRREARAYGELLPRVSVHRPACLLAAVDESNGQGVVVLEDVVAAGGTIHSAPDAPSVDGAADYLGTLAGLHASSWDSPLLERLPWLTVSLADDDMLRHWWDIPQLEHLLGHGGRAEVVDPLLQDPARLLSMLEDLAPIAARRPRCILHGDPHIGNTYRSGSGEPAFLDWQGISQGPWARDVSYFMGSNLEIEDRRVHERDLLGHYLEALAANGGPQLAFDEAWTEYRRWLVLPLLIWIGNSDLHQSAFANRTGAHRCSTAMMDLDCIDLFAPA